MNLKNKIAIVTGGSSGLGKAIALELAKKGSKVIICSRSEKNLNKVIEESKNITNNMFAISKDLTKENEVMELVNEVISKFNKIDILINNAGGYPKELYSKNNSLPLKIWEWSESNWDTIIEANLKTTFLCTKFVLQKMIKEQNGYIINMSSRMGRIASEMGAYAASKSAVIALTKTTALQTKKYNITVNAISPGMINTEAQIKYNNVVNNTNPSMENTTPIIKSILYLLCDAPKSMTGQSLDLFQKL